MKLNNISVLFRFAVCGLVVSLGSALATDAVAADSPQSADAQKKEIVRIKKSNSYIYYEVTAPTEADARTMAQSGLNAEIEAWAKTQKKLSASAAYLAKNVAGNMDEIAMPRGNMYRCFLYVKKSDVMGADNVQVVASGASAAAVSHPKIEGEGSQPSPVQISVVYPEIVNQIAAIKAYDKLAQAITDAKAAGKIKDYARYAKLVNPEACYLAVYNRSGEVVAVLTPGAERLNVATGQPDGVTNYTGCGAIGFEVAH